jgi:ATP-dependent DNA helicase RecG
MSCPKNRKPIKTKIVYESQLEDVYNFIKDEVDKGKQAFIVFPLVEKSEKMDLKSAVEHYENLSSDVFNGYKCGLLHGQMLWYEKEDTMRDFLDKKYQILIATTVIEVGIDIPNATVMLIQNAERFGLAQLHQLRGRVGRGKDQSYCLLATKDHFKFIIKKKENQQEERQSAIIRLKTMEETTDGFHISEVDLNLRGPGDILGTRQSGLPDFKFIELAKDGVIIKHARKEAFELIDSDPKLTDPKNSFLKEYLTNNYSESIKYFDIA